MTALLFALAIIGLVCVWTFLDRMRQEEDRAEREHDRALRREVRRHSDT